MPLSTRKHATSATVDKLVTHGSTVVKMLRELSEATNSSYLKPIAGISMLIFDTIQTVKANKEECVKMTEQTYELLCAIINICQDSTVELSPAMVYNIGHFSETLGQIASFLRQQVDGGLFKRIVRHVENSSLFAECKNGLNHAQEIFVVQTSVLLSADLANSQKTADERHQQLLEAISMRDRPGELSSNLRRSTSSLSMIPASPQIFHGRQKELLSVTNALLLDDPAHIAILGVGGIGKSTLALAALHHSEVVSKFSTRQYYISCASANSPSMLMNTVGRYFGAHEDQLKKPMQAVMAYILGHVGPSVLVLDNFETPWEPMDTRGEAEEFLSLLSGVKHLDIIVTMRGAERPGKIKWTRPFLPPLETLSSEAAHQIFFDIFGDPIDDEALGVTELLKLTDNLPLAVTLIAHLAAFEGCESVLTRWKVESTSVLSDGLDRRSNLDMSIMLSLTSPRMAATPGSRELLSLLSLLPDGISEVNLERTGVPLDNIARCRVTLCRTSLAFVDRDGRLNTLVPIRQYIRHSHPPSPTLLRPLHNFMCDLVHPLETWERSPVTGIFQQVTENLGNIQSLIDYALNARDVDIAQTIQCVIDLSVYDYVTNGFMTSLNLLLSVEQMVEAFLKFDTDANLQGRYWLALLRAGTNSPHYMGLSCMESWARKALQTFVKVNDITGKATTYMVISAYHSALGDHDKGVDDTRFALELSKEAGDAHLQSRALSHLSSLKQRQGHLFEGLFASNSAYEIAQDSGNLLDQARALMRRCECFTAIGRDFHRASSTIEEVLLLVDALGFGPGSALHQGLSRWKGEIAVQKTEYNNARIVYQELVGDYNLYAAAAHLSSSANTDPTELGAYNPVLSLLCIAMIDVATGDWDAARCGYNMDDRADILHSVLKHHSSVDASHCDILRGNLCFCRKQYDLAQRMFEQVLSSGRTQTISIEVTQSSRQGLVETVLAKADDNEASLRHSIVYLLGERRVQAWPAIHLALRCLGDVLLVGGDRQTAEVLYDVALEGFTFSDIHKDRAECMFRLGNMWKDRDPVKAATYWRDARPLFERSSQRTRIADCDAALAALELSSGQITEVHQSEGKVGDAEVVQESSVEELGVQASEVESMAEAESREVGFPQVPDDIPGEARGTVNVSEIIVVPA